MDSRQRENNVENERLHQRLRDIAQAVINDDDSFFDDYDGGRLSPRRLSPSRGADRFDSPDRVSRYVSFLFSRRVRTEFLLGHQQIARFSRFPITKYDNNVRLTLK